MSLPNITEDSHHHYYCRAQRQTHTFTFIWEIPNFLTEYKMFPLLSPFIEDKLCYFEINYNNGEIDYNSQINENKNKYRNGIYYSDIDSPSSNNKREINYSKNEDNLVFNIQFQPTQKILYKQAQCHLFLKNTAIHFCKKIVVPLHAEKITLGTVPMMYLLQNVANCLPNNTLTICIECQMYTALSQSLLHTVIENKESWENINDLVCDKTSLVTLVIDDMRLYADKNLICAKSPVFQAMFNCQMKESVTNEVKIIDIEYDILKLLLSYMQFNLLPNFATDNIQTLSKLLIAADKYKVENLKLLCETQLIKLMDSTNYIEFLDIARLDNVEYLKDYINKFMLMRGNMHNPQVAEMVVNSESLLDVTKCSKTNKQVSCSILKIDNSSIK